MVLASANIGFDSSSWEMTYSEAMIMHEKMNEVSPSLNGDYGISFSKVITILMTDTCGLT